MFKIQGPGFTRPNPKREKRIDDAVVLCSNKLVAARVDVEAPISALLVGGDSVAALTTDGRLITLRVSAILGSRVSRI